MEHRLYVARRRARFQGLSGPINIPWGAKLDAGDGVLLWNGLPLCAATSQNAHDCFVQDDDGRGVERGRLVAAILARLAKRDAGHQARWDKVWADPLCGRYRRRDSADHWLWNHNFYDAPVDDLRHIAALVGAKEVSHEEAH